VSDGAWFITQYRRWGMLRGAADDAAIAAAVNQTALYAQAAQAAGVDVPDEHRAVTFCDARVWDGADPAAYLDGFAIRA
jgi:two-component system, oxyanion-binding sensor